MMRIFTRTISIFILVFFSHTALAQLPGLKSFSLQEANRPVQINCIFKSADGLLYVGTNTGLFNFDGETFSKLYFKNKDYNDTVTAIGEDASKKIWAGFKSGRLATLVGDEVQFYNPEEGTPSKKISAICFDAKGNLWYAAYGEGIYYRRNNQHYLLNADNGLTDLNINTLCNTAYGEVLAGSDQGLVICPAPGSGKKVQTITPSQGLPDYIVKSVTPAGNNRFWVGMQDNGFCLYDHGRKNISVLSQKPGWHYGEVNDLLQDGDVLWIATQENGLVSYHIKNKVFQQSLLSSSNDVHQLQKDMQGNIWASDHQNNLITLKGNSIRTYPYQVPGLYEKIHALLYDSDGYVWMGEDQGVYRFKPDDNASRYHRIAIPVDFATDITALYEDPQKNIWIGTMGKGLFLYNKKNQSLRHVSTDQAIPHASVLSISGRDDIMYVCTLQGALSIHFSGTDGNAGFQVSRMDAKNGATHFIYSIFKDSKNRVWFATDGDGLWMQETDGSTKAFGEKEIKDGHVYSVTEDKKGNIWFSTASSGVYKYDGKNFTNFGLQQGISNLYISIVKALGSGNIAVVNKNGIDIIDPNSGNISYLQSADGMGTINADNLGAVSQDDDGRIFVTGEKGIISYDVQPGSKQHPHTILRSVNLFDQPVNEDQHIFPHDENNFTFHFIGLYFSNPSGVYYQYRLEGLDTNWINTMDKSQTFPKLGPGKYRFKVRSSLNKNFSNASEASYAFIIKRPFYTTWWFVSLVSLMIGSAFYLFMRNRERQIVKMQKLQNEKMQFQFEVLRNQVNPHFLFNSFNTLISTIEEDPKMAVEYTEQLSDFFRNIVSYRDKDTIVLAEELELLNTYFFLQRKRYGNALQMQINITDEQKMRFQIPPLSLQLLVENAIKHNVVAKDSPLMIEVGFAEPDRLIVFNKKNKRNIPEAGAGLGLQNIRNRFALLSKRPVIVENDSTHFLVNLPLVIHDSI